ncbi:MAG: NADH-quinone oxidoreductase subunit N [Caldimicrobium sp.]
MFALNLNFAALSLELILLISGIGIFLVDRFIKNKNYAFYLILVVLTVGFIFLLFTPFGEFTGAYKTDFYSNTLKFILLIAFALVIFASYSYLQDYKALNFGEYYGLLLFSIMGAFIMLSSQDLLTLFLGIELMSIPVYFLIGAGYVYKINSLEGALKYFIAGAISSLLFLLGLGIVYYLIGSLYLKDIFVKLTQNVYKKELLIGFLFFLSAFSIKLSFVPFHMWAPDAYESAPLPITAFLASLIKLAIFGALIKIIILGYAPLRIDLGNILAPISLLTIFLGALMAIKQDNIVRMLAYSSISHAGYASLGIVAGDYLGYGFSLFYILVYLFMTLGSFSLLIYLIRIERSFLYIPALSGISKNLSLVSFLILLFFFSLAGVPPTAGFMAKFYLFIMLLKSNYFGVALLALLFSVMGAYPYLRVLKVIYMDKPIYNNVTKKNYGFSLFFVVIFCAFIIIWLGVYPSPVVDFIQRTLYLYLSFLYFHF